MPGLLILFSFAAAIILVVVSGGTVLSLRRPPRFTFASALGTGLPTEPSEAGLVGKEITLRLSDGQASRGWLIEGRSPDPRAPVVILTHGWGESRHQSLERAALLAPFASRLIAYDLRGHGESAPRWSDLATTEVDDLLAILGQLDALGLDPRAPLVLAGYSLGGGISIAAASRANDLPTPSPVRGVMVDGAYCRGMDPIDGYFRFRRWPRYPFRWPIALYLHFFLQRSQDFDRARHARRMNCPLLLLHGERDEICTPESARAIVAGKPDARVVFFAQGMHLDLARVDAPRYVEAVESFLRDVARPPLASPAHSAATTPREPA